LSPRQGSVSSFRRGSPTSSLPSFTPSASGVSPQPASWSRYSSSVSPICRKGALRWITGSLNARALRRLSPALDVLSPRGFIQSKPRLLRGDVLSLPLHAPAEWHEVATQMHQGASGDRAREGLRNPHYSNVGVDGVVERKVF